MSDPRAPLESWQIGPWNRWAYQHVGAVVPTVRVPRGDGPARALRTSAARTDGADDGGRGPAAPAGPGGAEPGGLGLDELESPPGLDGLAVLRGDVLLHERYAHGLEPGTRHLSQSVAKSVLGLLVGVLAGRGALDPDAPVVDLVPEVAGGGYAGATLRHLLDMTAATDFVEDYAHFQAYDAACGWHPQGPGARAILEYLPTIGPAPDGRQHGRTFHYASPNTDLLGVAAERAGGAPLPTLVARELWGPMGAEADAELAVDPAGTAVISGGLSATLRDYARLGLLVLDDGRGVVPRDWTAALGAGDPAAWAGRAWPPADAGTGESGYAAAWWTQDGRVVARGIHGQLVAVDRRAGVVVAMLSSWPTATDPAAEAAQRRLVDAICDRVCGRS